MKPKINQLFRIKATLALGIAYYKEQACMKDDCYLLKMVDSNLKPVTSASSSRQSVKLVEEREVEFVSYLTDDATYVINSNIYLHKNVLYKEVICRVIAVPDNPQYCKIFKLQPEDSTHDIGGGCGMAVNLQPAEFKKYANTGVAQPLKRGN